MSGSLPLAAITGFFIAHASAPADAKTVLGKGSVGAFTTFSTLMYELVRLLRSGANRHVLMNILGSSASRLAAADFGSWRAVRLFA
jgi:fluoride exporter